MKHQALAIIISLFFGIEKSDYYDALSSNNIITINSMIEKIKEEEKTSMHQAYLGSLIAKKSGHLKDISQKINLFKKGISLLENEISTHPEVAEYKFLRLILQEQSPRILNYKNNISKDCQDINKNFSAFDDELKIIILQYSKNSKFLSIESKN